MPSGPILFLLSLGVLALIGVGCAGMGWFFYAQAYPFRNSIREYCALAGTGAAARSPAEVKKFVVVDTKAGEVDSVHYLLPKALQARWPSEVTTVALVRWNSQVVGQYKGGGVACRIDAEVQVIDLKSRATLGRRTFTGAPPPSSVVGRRGRGYDGERPQNQVIDYLTGLAQAAGK